MLHRNQDGTEADYSHNQESSYLSVSEDEEFNGMSNKSFPIAPPKSKESQLTKQRSQQALGSNVAKRLPKTKRSQMQHSEQLREGGSILDSSSRHKIEILFREDAPSLFSAHML
jgi:hypothetical protein